MDLTYDEYVSLGGKLSDTDFLSNINKSKGFINGLARIYTVSYSDENIKFALSELVDTFQAETNSESDTLAFTAGSYSEKTVKASKSINYPKKRYDIASRYLEISRVAKRW